MIKKLLAIVLTAMLVLSLAACGGTPASSEAPASTEAPSTAESAEPTGESEPETTAKKNREDIVLAVSFRTLQEQRWVDELGVIEDVCEEQGIEFLYQISDNDIQKQVSQIENLVSQGIDILILMGSEKDVLNNVLLDAHDAGVFVAFYEQVNGELYFDIAGGNDYFDIGELITKTVGDMGITGDVAYLYGDAAGGTGVMNFKDGMHEGMKGSPDVNVIGEQFVENWDPTKAMAYAENWIAEYGDTLSAILCVNDGMAGGTIQALENAGLAGKVLVTGQDCELLALQRIAAGTQTSTVMKGGLEFPRVFTEMAIDYYLGEITDADFNGTDTDSLGNTKPFYNFPGVIITKDNLDEVVIEGGMYTQEEIYGA